MHTLNIIGNRIYLNGQMTAFELKEFVPKSILDRFGNNSLWFLDPRIIAVSHGIRNFFGAAMTINTDIMQGRGFRMPDSPGAPLSQHKFGRAIDFNIKGKTSDEVYNEILTNERTFINLGVTTLEDKRLTPSWTHVDIRYTGNDKLLIVA